MLQSQRILCPVDFSEASVEAVRKAMTMAPKSADFLFLHVLPEPFLPAVKTELALSEIPTREETYNSLKELILSFLPNRVHARSLVLSGDVAAVILQTAATENTDLIVMPTHGANGWREFALGSTTDEVVRLAPCPVLTMNESALAIENAKLDHSGSTVTEPNAKCNGQHATETRPVSCAPCSATYGEDDFPMDGSPQAKLHFLLHYAILAPSNRNSQPWLWRFNGDAVDLYTDRMRALPYLDPVDRELILSCGAALMHLRLAIRHFGYSAVVETFPNPDLPDLLARVRLGESLPATEDEDLLFEAIFQRHTNRQPFLDRNLPESLVTALIADARQEGAELFIIENHSSRHELVDLIAEADVIQSNDAGFRGEAWKWIRASGDARGDGLREDALHRTSPLHTGDLISAQADANHLLASHAPVIAVLETKDDTPQDWLAAGRALARLLLRASAKGVQANFFNSPIEVRSMWPQLHHLLRHASVPQMVLRLGYPISPAEATVRRPVEECAVTENTLQP